MTGQHAAESETPSPAQSQRGLLSSLRVIEVALLAPSALGGHLAELGADVIKVESGRGDYVRSIGRRAGQQSSDMHQLWNRGKRSVALKLSTPEGQNAFRDLVRDAEVVIEGRRPGYLGAHGLGYEALLEVNPSLVFVSLSGFGATGPYASVPSHGPAFDSYAGLLKPIEDSRGRPRIPKPDLAIGVTTAPLHAAMATLAAVIHARETARPAYLDIAQADAAAYARALDLARWAQDTASNSAQDGNAAADPMNGDLFEESVLVQYYRTSDGHYILFQAMERKFFDRFLGLVGRTDLAEHFPADADADWLYGRDDIRAALAEIFATRTSSEWVAFGLANDIPCTPVNTDAMLLSDPHFQSRARWLQGECGSSVPGLPIQAIPPLDIPRPAPDFGSHTAAVLQHRESARSE